MFGSALRLAWLSPVLVAIGLLMPSIALADSRSAVLEAQKAEALLTYDYTVSETLKLGWQTLGIYTLIYGTVWLLAFWPISRLIAKKTGTIPNALAYFAQLLVASVILLVVMVFGVRSESILIVAAGGIVYLVASVIMARASYEVGVLKAIGLAVIGWLLSGAGDIVTGLVYREMPWRALKRIPAQERGAFLAKWDEERKKTPVAGSTPAPLTPAAPLTVQEMYTNLQKSRERLNLNDPAAVTAFNEQVAAYNAAKAAQVAPVGAATPPPRATPSTKAKSTPKPSKKAKPVEAER